MEIMPSRRFNPGDAGWFLQKPHRYTLAGTVRRCVCKFSALLEKTAAVNLNGSCRPLRRSGGQMTLILHLKKSATICFFGRISFDAALTLPCPELDSNL